MWPDLKDTPIEDYEYAVAGGGRGVYGRPPRLLHLSPGLLASLIGGAFALGVAAGYVLSEVFDD
ncbi:MAG: hypothetical protein ACK4YQ_05655 [Phenylobacterium sp.]|uniref:hypothetical protein n=1 Tax=Phenylobacterium sp. TaxID=1871053 RepID=UPI00391CDEE3